MDASREPRKRRNVDPFCQEETSDEDTKHVNHSPGSDDVYNTWCQSDEN